MVRTTTSFSIPYRVQPFDCRTDARYRPFQSLDLVHGHAVDRLDAVLRELEREATGGSKGHVVFGDRLGQPVTHANSSRVSITPRYRLCAPGVVLFGPVRQQQTEIRAVNVPISV